MCMIDDAIRRYDGVTHPTIVVVAPRILLAEQLSSEFLEVIENVSVMHVHSGETSHFSTTKADMIEKWVRSCKGNKIIFTTYHSLHRLVEADIIVDTIYFDEAHNAIQKNFIESVDHYSLPFNALRSYFFTATPKHSRTPFKVGMNNTDIFGNVIVNVPAPKLVDQGYILPPKVEVYKTRLLQKDEIYAEVESENILSAIDNLSVDKVLICAKSTKQIVSLISQTDFCCKLKERGYNWMYITAKTGAIINGKKVGREEFFNTLNGWGRDDTRFIVLHHSILSEGINVAGLEAALFMRNMDYISISQTIGRVIRLGKCHKTHGKVCIPVYNNVGISTARKVEAVVDTVFNKGEPAISVITR